MSVAALPAGPAVPGSPAILMGRPAALGLTAVYLVCAALLITNFDLRPIAHEKFGLVFNDMARRLLHWDFSISPEIILFEAFVRDGVSYSYYGIFPALLRMPLAVFGETTLQIGRVSCLAALGLTVYPYLRLMQVAAVGAPARPVLVAAALISVVATGPQVFLLAAASLYHELIFWAAAFTAIFNLIVMRRWLRHEELDFRDMLALALLAGLCLLCRANVGAGLYLALLLLLIRHARQGLRAARPGQRLGAALAMPAWLREPLTAGCLALVFVAVMGVVNAERWGNALTASPYIYYIQFINDPVALERYSRHGLFSWTRVAVAVAYYTTGFKVDSVFPVMFEEYYGSIEGPRALVPLTAPLLMLLMAAGATRVLRHPARHLVPILLLAGNLAAVALMLGFHALCLRYVFDAWGMVVVLAALGVPALAPNWHGARYAVFIGALLLGGIAASQLTLLRYKINYSGTDAEIRYTLSKRIQPMLCPQATLDPAVKLTDFIPLVTPACPPLW